MKPLLFSINVCHFDDIDFYRICTRIFPQYMKIHCFKSVLLGWPSFFNFSFQQISQRLNQIEIYLQASSIENFYFLLLHKLYCFLKECFGSLSCWHAALLPKNKKKTKWKNKKKITLKEKQNNKKEYKNKKTNNKKEYKN